MLVSVVAQVPLVGVKNTQAGKTVDQAFRHSAPDATDPRETERSRTIRISMAALASEMSDAPSEPPSPPVV